MRSLAGHVDPAYRAFLAPLVPSVDARRIVGVRTPELRRIARELVRRDDRDGFLGTLPHGLFEEMQVHALAIGLERDYDAALARFDAFLPYVDNWATCDQLPVRALAAHPEETLVWIGRWLGSGRCYPMRFAIRVLMAHYLDERFEPRFLDLVAAAHLVGETGKDVATGAPASAGVSGRARDDDAYYLDMMRAWYFAEAVVRQPAAAMSYLEPSGSAVARCPCRVADWPRRVVERPRRTARRMDPPQGHTEGRREPPRAARREGAAAGVALSGCGSSPCGLWPQVLLTLAVSAGSLLPCQAPASRRPCEKREHGRDYAHEHDARPVETFVATAEALAGPLPSRAHFRPRPAPTSPGRCPARTSAPAR